MITIGYEIHGLCHISKHVNLTYITGGKISSRFDVNMASSRVVSMPDYPVSGYIFTKIKVFELDKS